MILRHRIAFAGPALAGLAASPAFAAGLDVTVAIPQLKVAEYHKPYVALWIEGEGQPFRPLALWYQVVKKSEDGTKWLNELRTWWRKGGRSLALPADGLSSATRAPGPQRAAFPASAKALAGLAPGNYTLVVEAVREVGGRELVRVPFAWGKPGTARAAGTTELGAVTVNVTR